MRRLTLSLFMAIPLVAIASAPASTDGLRQGIQFTDYPAFARNGELLRRLASPLNALRIEQKLAKKPDAMRAHPLDPAQQHYALYVPQGPQPPAGYALMVFVPPWKDARVPPQWIPVLDREHVIFVTAADSGNDANVSNRREPLALLAAWGVMQHYHVDPARVYIAGFSGGARVALRLALGYPDVFQGALLDAGSDPIGTAQVPLPPAGLFRQFQQSTRLVFLTGSDDRGPNRGGSAIFRPETQESPVSTDLYEKERQGFGLMTVTGENGMYRGQDPTSIVSNSLKHWCVQHFDFDTLNGVGHELAGPSALERALGQLARGEPTDQEKLASCRAEVDDQLDAQFKHAQSLLDHGKYGDAQAWVNQIDAQYGGLAAPRSLQLLQAIDSHDTQHR